MRGSAGRFSARRGKRKGSVMSGLQAMMRSLPAPTLHVEADQPAFEVAGIVGEEHHLVEADLQHLRARYARLRCGEALHRDAHHVLDAGDTMDAPFDGASVQRLAEAPFIR